MKREDGMPMLAGCVGDYREYRPSAPLERHFLCTWSNTIPRTHEGPVAVVPDGCVDLVWIEGRLVVAGPDESAALTTLAPGTTVAGIRFRPGAATKWLGLPMCEIVGLRVDLCDFWGGQARRLACAIGDAGTLAGRLNCLETGLGRIAPHIGLPAPDMERVFHALRRKRADDPEASVPALCRRLEISERSLRRHCRKTFGYGPKTLERILRFQRFLRLTRHPGERRLSLLADEAGYADQAHLTREVRRLSGFSPSMILRQVAG